MSVPRTRWVPLLVGLVVVVGLPVAARWVRRSADHRCALDGSAIHPIYRVEVRDHHDTRHEFCCVRCAEIWLQRQTAPAREVVVTDETTGETVDAAAAWYVRSQVVTTPTTGNRVHVFRHRTDAERHADAHGGVLLPESANPFRKFLEKGKR